MRLFVNGHDLGETLGLSDEVRSKLILVDVIDSVPIYLAPDLPSGDTGELYDNNRQLIAVIRGADTEFQFMKAKRAEA